jgi:NTE family protein
VSNQEADLVFEGGGVKGIGLAGAFREVSDRGWKPGCVAGTSAGAITAALVAAGYNGEQLERLVLTDMHFPLFADEPKLHLLGPVGEVVDVLKDRGLHSGNYFLRWITDLLKDKGVETFGDLRVDSEAGTKREYTLRVIASDLSDHAMLVLPDDAEKLGVEPQALSVAEAVRMSMSIPVFFDPVIKSNSRDGRKHMIVDGGMLSNYPIWLFDVPPGQRPARPTFGMLLVAPNQEDPLLPNPPAAELRHDGMPSLLGYVKALADTMMQAHDRLYVEEANFARTIPIPTCGVSTTDFAISTQKTKELFESGRKAAAEFLNDFDFDTYISKFRTTSPPGRRETLFGSPQTPSATSISRIR